MHWNIQLSIQTNDYYYILFGLVNSMFKMTFTCHPVFRSFKSDNLQVMCPTFFSSRFSFKNGKLFLFFWTCGIIMPMAFLFISYQFLCSAEKKIASLYLLWENGRLIDYFFSNSLSAEPNRSAWLRSNCILFEKENSWFSFRLNVEYFPHCVTYCKEVGKYHWNNGQTERETRPLLGHVLWMHAGGWNWKDWYI